MGRISGPLLGSVPREENPGELSEGGGIQECCTVSVSALALFSVGSASYSSRATRRQGSPEEVSSSPIPTPPRVTLSPGPALKESVQSPGPLVHPKGKAAGPPPGWG